MRKRVSALAVSTVIGPIGLSNFMISNAYAASSVSAETVEVPPLTGANSFTEVQAKARIEAEGFTQVSTLLKDENGIWRGTAAKAGATVNVALDFKGNVVSMASDGAAAKDANAIASGTPKAAVETPSAPAAGIMTMTPDQAKARFEAAGYSDVTGVMKDDAGIWHATAAKDGTAVKLSLNGSGDVITGDGDTSKMSAAGGMTDAEAKLKIEAEGYTQVGELALGEDGLWHANAMKNGNMMKVLLDPKKGTLVAN